MGVLLLADSGSTKTDWLLINEGQEELRFKTVGFNPYFVDTSHVYDILKEEFTEKFDLSIVDEVYFYGAGCSSGAKKAVINNALQQLFPHAKTDVEHDLLGAARALLGHSKGIAGILGTGSNSCLYNGADVVETIFSLGYMFGDEGSGAHLGKTYITSHLKKKVPQEIYEAFENSLAYSPEEILTHVYKKPNPNRFLASFSVFLKSHIEHPYVSELVENCFEEYFKEQVCLYTGYKELPFCFIGSVGYNFKPQLENAARKFDISIGNYMSSPMEGLVEYHLK